MRPITDLEALRESRRQAVQRTRRVIYNNDGMDAVFQARGKDSIEGILRHWTAGLAGSHVDTIAYNTNIGGFGLFFHDTKIGEVFTSREGKWANNLTGALIEQGTDPLRIMTDFARANNMEIFWSLRMNNFHDIKSPELISAFKKAHPEFLMGTPSPASQASQPGAVFGNLLENPGQRLRRGAWSAVDFGRKEVRDLVVKIIEEVCRNYDVDGVQLDFLRLPILFRSTAKGGRPSQDEKDALTAMMGDIRRMTERVGLEKGRPLLLALRTPDSVDYCRDITGMEIERWLADDLVDILCVGGDAQMRPWTESIALGKRYGVPVYPSLKETGATMSAPMRQARDEPPGWRGAALAAWEAGASGIEVFNMMYFYPPDHPLYREIGDPGLLRKQDRVYTVTRLSPAGLILWLDVDDEYFSLPVLTQRRPLQLRPGEPASLPIWLGETHTEPILSVVIRLNLPGWTDTDVLSVGLNERPAVLKGADEDWLEFSLEPAALRSGKNAVVVKLESERALLLCDLTITVIPAERKGAY